MKYIEIMDGVYSPKVQKQNPLKITIGAFIFLIFLTLIANVLADNFNLIWK